MRRSLAGLASPGVGLGCPWREFRRKASLIRMRSGHDAAGRRRRRVVSHSRVVFGLAGEAVEPFASRRGGSGWINGCSSMALIDPAVIDRSYAWKDDRPDTAAAVV